MGTLLSNEEKMFTEIVEKISVEGKIIYEGKLSAPLRRRLSFKGINTTEKENVTEIEKNSIEGILGTIA